MGEILDQVEVNADRLDPVDLVTTRNVLWEGTTQPDRLELVAQLRRRGMVKDEIRLFTGLRTYSLDSRRNFLLNGHPYPLKGKVLEEPESLEDILAQIRTARRAAAGRSRPSGSRGVFHHWRP